MLRARPKADYLPCPRIAVRGREKGLITERRHLARHEAPSES